MVHQLNVIQIIKMDTPAVLFMDGVEIQWLIVHVMVALITVKVNFEKKNSLVCVLLTLNGLIIKPWEFEITTIICLGSKRGLFLTLLIEITKYLLIKVGFFQKNQFVCITNFTLSRV